ncbi:hypothetical protein ACO0LB_06145 [Undibacterium sp. SXout7W]
MFFRVTVRTATAEYHYFAIATESAAVFNDAYDRFGVCGVSVNLMKGAA